MKSVLIVLLILFTVTVHAAVPVPIKDINTLTESGSVGEGAVLGGNLYITLCKDEDFFGCEPYRVPVGGAGAELLKDVVPGPDGSFPEAYAATGNQLFFVTNNQLWKSDGTEDGTTSVIGFSEIRNNEGQRLVAVGNEVAFVAESNSSVGRELWVSDGASATLYSVCAGSCDGNPQSLTVSGNKLFFRGNSGSGTRLYVYESGNGVSVVGDIVPSAMAAFGAGVIVSAGGDDGINGFETGLYTSDGVTNVKVAGSAQNFSGFTEAVVAGGRAFFSAFDFNAAAGQEIWTSDGSTGGTGLLVDIRPGNQGSSPQDLVAVGGGVFFTATDGVNGRELWYATSGGAAPLELVPGSGGPSLERLTNLNGSQLFFMADIGDGAGTEPWVSNGSPGGTGRVIDLKPGGDSGFDGSPIIATSGLAYFAGRSALASGLWRSNGSPGGTVLQTGLSSRNQGSSISQITSFNGFGVFCADNGLSGKEPWRTDGTTAGTIQLDDLSPTFGCDLGNDGLVPYNGALYFRGFNGSTFGLFRSNGNPGGASLVKAFAEGPEQLTVHNGVLYFVAAEAGSLTGKELWRSDGTTVGTFEVKDVFPGSLPGNIQDLTSASGLLLFSARANSTGDFELWKSDGTETGTVVVTQIRVGNSGSFPRDFAGINGLVVFSADDGSNGRELWVTDGTPGGTSLLKDINGSGNGLSSTPGFTVLGGFAYFAADNGSDGRELWRTDGTSVGTTQFADINGSSGSFPGNFAVAGSRLYFSADDGVVGEELWQTDGSSTTRLKDINPTGDGRPGGFFATGNGDGAYFAADRDDNGDELWITDGTPSGTQFVSDLGPDGGSPQSFAAVSSGIVFVASASTFGEELWGFDAVDCGDAPDPDYPTLTASNGPCHRVASGVSTPILGSARDTEDAGLPTAAADGDDNDGSSDEDGVVFSTPLDVGRTATLEITLNAAGRVNGWIDWNADGGWDQIEDRILFNADLLPGTSEIDIAVPESATLGTTFARFRVDSLGTPFVTGLALDGEVEDYAIEITEKLDFGDAPDPSYATLLANNGARHRVVDGVYLGAGVDADDDGQPDAAALGDDLDAGGDDEDGVTFTSALVQDSDATVEVTASVDGCLYAWIDFDQDGAWNGFEELVIDGQDVFAGTNNFNLAIPVSALDGATFARFRYDTRCDADQPTGAVEDGEVEDHQVTVGAPPLAADAGPDQAIAPNNDPVVLGGNPSATGGTPPYTYAWSVTPGVAGVDWSLSSTTAAAPVFTGFTNQVFTATLIVTDNDGAMDMDDAEVTVAIPQVRDFGNLPDISGTEVFEACSVVVADNVTILDGADVTVIAPEVEFGPDFNVETGAILEVVIGLPSGCVP